MRYLYIQHWIDFYSNQTSVPIKNSIEFVPSFHGISKRDETIVEPVISVFKSKKIFNWVQFLKIWIKKVELYSQRYIRSIKSAVIRGQSPLILVNQKKRKERSLNFDILRKTWNNERTNFIEKEIVIWTIILGLNIWPRTTLVVWNLLTLVVLYSVRVFWYLRKKPIYLIRCD